MRDIILKHASTLLARHIARSEAEGECSCETGFAWVGVHLTGAIGQPWSSRNPRVIGNIYDMQQNDKEFG